MTCPDLRSFQQDKLTELLRSVVPYEAEIPAKVIGESSF